MVIQTNDKYKIKYDADEKQYIFFRVIDKSELAAHLAEANKQLASIHTAINLFQGYIDDERVIEPKEPEP